MYYGVSLSLPRIILTLSLSAKFHHDGSYEASAQHHSFGSRPITAADEWQVLINPLEYPVEHAVF